MARAPSPPDDDAPVPLDGDAAQIEALLAGGHWAEAASRLCDVGELARAQGLLERLWDFAGAAALATRRGDRPDALRLFIEARDRPAVARALDEIGAAPEMGELARAADVCERRQMWREAARLREQGGDDARAHALYVKAGLDVEAARLDEKHGRLRDAGRRYERALALEPGASESALPIDDRRRAQLALGRVLARLGHHEGAVRQLQRGLGTAAAEVAAGAVTLDEATLREGRARLARSLAALGLAADPDPSAAADDHGDDDHGDDDARLLAGRYVALRLLGSGGMGRVYLARDRATDERVAIKLVAAPVDARSREGYRRFLRETRIVSALRHPHVVAVRAVDEAHAMLVMEYLPSGTLADRLGAPLAPAVVRTVLVQLASALEAAHLHGVVHRDLKPANVFFAATGEARLGDFGVAHLQDLGATLTGGFVGTLAYMSPEQIAGGRVTWATDLYALGVTAYQMVAGRLPFLGPDLVGQHLGAVAPPPSTLRPDGDARFDALVLRLLEKDPAARGAGLDELRREILAIALDDPPAAAPRATPIAAGETRADATGAGAPRERIAGDAERYRIEAEIARTPASVLFRGVDERLGRSVIVERWSPAAFDGAAGSARRLWLQAMARHGSPELQRVLRIETAIGRAVYEDVGGVEVSARDVALARADCARLVLDALRALAGVHAEGVAHGRVAAALLLDPARAVVRVAGHAPDDEAPRDDVTADLIALAALARQLGGEAVADLPQADATSTATPDLAAALAAWARAALA